VGIKPLTSALDVTNTYGRAKLLEKSKEFGSSETPQNERKEEKLEVVRLEQATIDKQFVSVPFGYDDEGNQEYVVARNNCWFLAHQKGMKKIRLQKESTD
jgi:hypothetical protein